MFGQSLGIVGIDALLLQQQQAHYNQANLQGLGFNQQMMQNAMASSAVTANTDNRLLVLLCEE